MLEPYAREYSLDEPTLFIEGAAGCSHGCSAARRKAGGAQPVGAVFFDRPAPQGAAESPETRGVPFIGFKNLLRPAGARRR